MKWLDEGRKIVKLELELYLAELIELLPVTYMMNCFCRKVDGQKAVTTHSYLSVITTTSHILLIVFSFLFMTINSVESS